MQHSAATVHITHCRASSPSWLRGLRFHVFNLRAHSQYCIQMHSLYHTVNMLPRTRLFFSTAISQQLLHGCIAQPCGSKPYSGRAFAGGIQWLKGMCPNSLACIKVDFLMSNNICRPSTLVSLPSPATTQCSETISSAEGGSELTIVPDSFIQEVLHECVSRFMLFCFFITSIAIYPRYVCCRLAFVLSFDMSNTTRYPPGVKTVFPVEFPNKWNACLHSSLCGVSPVIFY